MIPRSHSPVGDRALSAALLALELLVGTGLIVKTGTGTYAVRTLQEGAGIDITNGDGVAGDPTITVDLSEVQHDTLAGLADNDHPQYLLVADIDDVPVNGVVTAPISSNWAFDHIAAADPHTQYVLSSEYTAADVLAKLLTVDGAASGLDADLLDGLNSLAFLKADGSVALTGNLAVNALVTIDGRDISVDGTKLDGIESGATADQTAAEILALLLTVDGAGSGLDADLLDGNSSAAFSLAGHTHLLSGITDVTMTVTNLNTLDDGINTTLHFHDADRARANHTGTQLAATISDFAEAVDDRVDTLIVDGTGIDTVYDDGVGTLTITVDLSELSTTTLPEGTNLYFTDERAQDAVGAILTNGGGLTWTYNDAGNTISAVVSITASQVSDFDTEVSNNTDVAANTAARHAAVTVLDSSTIDFTLVGQQVTGIVIDNSIGNTHLRDSAALSVIGRAANSVGDPADITAGANDRILARTADALSFVQLTVGMFPNDVVTYAKIQNVSATDRILGRDTAAAGDIEELTVSGGIEFTGAGGIRTTAFTGDVTKAAGGTAQTIANDAVTNAKAANMLANTIKGRITASTGDPEDLTATQVRTIINVENGATADQTAAEILAALLTVDGAASGLDADLLDGQSGSYYLDLANHTGNLFLSDIISANTVVPDTKQLVAIQQLEVANGITLEIEDGGLLAVL